MTYGTVNIGGGRHPAQQLMHHDAVCSSAGLGKLSSRQAGGRRPSSASWYHAASETVYSSISIMASSLLSSRVLEAAHRIQRT
ncbi:MAG: hypothetical protein MZV63_23510 [Marinilabiliales bacterium]|nr:hypothetical protein [Marinilabiliales bacterium]